MKKVIKHIRYWLLKRLMSKHDMNLLLLGSDILDDWIQDRKIRRKMKDTKYDVRIKQIVQNW
jgi:hypothetical protein